MNKLTVLSFAAIFAAGVTVFYLPSINQTVKTSIAVSEVEAAHSQWVDSNEDSEVDGFYAMPVNNVITTDPYFVRSVLDSVGASEVEFIITDNMDNCGVRVALLNNHENIGGGCFRSTLPNHIYVSENLPSTDSTKSLILHEYAHVLQYRESGSEKTMIDYFRKLFVKKDKEVFNKELECDADERAIELGASKELLYYQINGLCSASKNEKIRPSRSSL